MNTQANFNIYDGAFVSDRIALGSYPKPEEVKDITSAGIRCIINLVSYCGPEPMAYLFHLPEHVHWLHLGMWDGWLGSDKPGYKEKLSCGYARFLVQKAAIAMREHSPVLIHCMSGFGRSGNVAAILLAASRGISAQRAVEVIGKKREIAGFAKDGLWKEAGGEEIVELARRVLNESDTPPELIRKRVFDGI